MGATKLAMLLVVITGGVLMQIDSGDAVSDPGICIGGFKRSGGNCNGRREFSNCLLGLDLNPEDGIAISIDLSSLGNLLGNLLGGLLGGRPKCDDNLEETLVNTLLKFLECLVPTFTRDLPGGSSNGTDAKEFCRDSVPLIAVKLSLTCPIIADYLGCILDRLGIDIEKLTGTEILQLERNIQKGLDKLRLVCLEGDIIGRFRKTTRKITFPTISVTRTVPTTTSSTRTYPTTTSTTSTVPTTTSTTRAYPTTTSTTSTVPTTTSTTRTYPTTTSTTSTVPTTTSTTRAYPTTTSTTSTVPTTSTTRAYPTTTSTTSTVPTTTSTTSTMSTTSTTIKTPLTLKFCILAFNNTAHTCADRRVLIDCIMRVDFSLYSNQLIIIDLSSLVNILRDIGQGGEYRNPCNDELVIIVVKLHLSLLDSLTDKVLEDLSEGTGNAPGAKTFCRNQVTADVTAALSLTCPIIANYLGCIFGELEIYPGALTDQQLYQLRLTIQLFLEKNKLNCFIDDIVARLPTTTTRITAPTTTTPTTSTSTTIPTTVSTTPKTPPTLEFCLRALQNSDCTCSDRKVFIQCIILVDLRLKNNPAIIIDLGNLGMDVKDLAGRGAGSTCNDDLYKTMVFFILNRLDLLADTVSRDLRLGTENALEARAFCRDQGTDDVTAALSLTCSIIANYLGCIFGELEIYPGALTGQQLYQLRLTIQLFLEKNKLNCFIDDIVARLPTTTTRITAPTTTTPTTSTSTTIPTTVSTTTKTPPTLEFCFRALQNSDCTCSDRKVFIQCIILVDLRLKNNPAIIIDLGNLGKDVKDLAGRGAGSTCNDDLYKTMVFFILNRLDVLADMVSRDLRLGTGNAPDAKAFCRTQVTDGVAAALSLTSSIIADYLECFFRRLEIYPGALTGAQIYQLERIIQLFLDNNRLVCLITDITGRLTTTTTQITSPKTSATSDVPPDQYPGCLKRPFDDCKGKLNGNYPICHPECLRGIFVTCSNNLTTIFTCAQNHKGQFALVYDPDSKSCQPSSAFCPR